MRGLTVIDERLESAERLTAPGMAHWAGSGPDGAVCGKCIFYGYTYVKSNGDHANKRAACEKFWTNDAAARRDFGREASRLQILFAEGAGMSEPQAGHNSVAADQLKAVIERIENLEAEKANLGVDIREIYLEAKGNGLDVKALRTIVRLRKMDANDRAEQDAILETYMHALGMV